MTLLSREPKPLLPDVRFLLRHLLSSDHKIRVTVQGDKNPILEATRYLPALIRVIYERGYVVLYVMKDDKEVGWCVVNPYDSDDNGVVSHWSDTPIATNAVDAYLERVLEPA